MKIRADRDGFTLSTGREVYANCRLVGIPIVEQEGDDPCEFAEGYDGNFSVHNPVRHTDESAEYMLTVAEGLEVCDAMIEAWKRRKKALRKTPQAGI